MQVEGWSLKRQEWASHGWRWSAQSVQPLISLWPSVDSEPSSTSTALPSARPAWVLIRMDNKQQQVTAAHLLLYHAAWTRFTGCSLTLQVKAKCSSELKTYICHAISLAQRVKYLLRWSQLLIVWCCAEKLRPKGLWCQFTTFILFSSLKMPLSTQS